MQKRRQKARRISSVILLTLQKVSPFFVWAADILIIGQSQKLSMQRICSLLVFTVSRVKNYIRNNVHCRVKMTGTTFTFIFYLVSVLEGQTVNCRLHWQTPWLQTSTNMYSLDCNALFFLPSVADWAARHVTGNSYSSFVCWGAWEAKTSKVKPLCIVLHSNGKSTLEFNFFLKTPFVYYFIRWGL